MPVDPNIILSSVQAQRQGTTPFQDLGSIIQLQGLLQQQQQRQQDAQAQQAEREKQQQLSDLLQKNISPTDKGIQLDQPAFLQDLLKLDPQMALKEQQRIATQQQATQLSQAKVAKEQAQETKFLREADVKEIEAEKDRIGVFASSAGAVLDAPPENQLAVLGTQVRGLMDRKMIDQEGAQNLLNDLVPTGQITPETIAKLDSINKQGISAVERADLALRSRKQKQERLLKESPKQKSERERKEKQADLSLQLPEIVKVRKGRKITSKNVESAQKIIPFGGEMVDNIQRARDAIGDITRFGIIGAKFDPGNIQMSAIASELRALQLQEKGPEGANLGVLAGPDLGILNEITGSPEAMQLILKSPKAMLDKLDRLEQRLVNKTNTKLKSQNLTEITRDSLRDLTKEALEFKSNEDLLKAVSSGTVKVGDKITVGGRPAVVRE